MPKKIRYSHLYYDVLRVGNNLRSKDVVGSRSPPNRYLRFAIMCCGEVSI